MEAVGERNIVIYTYYATATNTEKQTSKNHIHKECLPSKHSLFPPYAPKKQPEEAYSLFLHTSPT